MQYNGNICFGEVVVDIMRFFEKNTSLPAIQWSEHPLTDRGCVVVSPCHVSICQYIVNIKILIYKDEK